MLYLEDNDKVLWEQTVRELTAWGVGGSGSWEKTLEAVTKPNPERLMNLYSQPMMQWENRAGKLTDHMPLSLDFIREQWGASKQKMTWLDLGSLEASSCTLENESEVDETASRGVTVVWQVRNDEVQGVRTEKVPNLGSIRRWNQ